MAQKTNPTPESKKPGKSLKEKRAAKNAKEVAQKAARKSWEK